MITKPGFILNRIKLLFSSKDNNEKNRILNLYNKWRNKQPKKERHCYCGHTIDCECANPGLYEFKSGLNTGTINETVLNKIL